jgi:hypothetical protein
MDQKLMEEFYDAWNWLDKHPAFTPFGDGGTGCLHIDIVKVNPENETIEDDESLNTAVRIWLEGGPWHDEHEGEKWGEWMIDWDLNSGGSTFEEAFLMFVKNAKKKYGDYGEYEPICYAESITHQDVINYLKSIE